MPLAEHCPLCSTPGEFVAYEDGRRWERWRCTGGDCGHDWRVEGPNARGPDDEFDFTGGGL